MNKYFIVCPLIFLAGLIDSIAGGGGLISLPAYLMAGLPVHNAIATNKLSSSLGTSMATYQYAKQGFIPWKIAAVCAAFSVLGSEIGANISLLISDDILKKLMLFLIPATAVLVSKSKTLVNSKDKYKDDQKKNIVIAFALAFVFGAYDGFYGPGTGTFLLLFLSVAAKMDLKTANGVTKAINFASNVSALAVYLVNGKTMIPLGLTAGVFSILGNYLGTRLFSKNGIRIARPAMLLVLAVFFIKIVFEMF